MTAIERVESLKQVGSLLAGILSDTGLSFNSPTFAATEEAQGKVFSAIEEAERGI